MEKDDFLKIPSSDMLRISSRQDSSQSQYEQQKKKKDKKPDIDEENSIEDLDLNELIEFGRLVFKKGNTDLKLFTRLKKENLMNTLLDIDDISFEETSLAKEDEVSVDSESETILDIDPEQTLSNMIKLYEYYQNFFVCVQDESKILNDEEIDDFENIINQKDEVLNQIDKLLKKIDFKIFEKFHPKNEKKIKANQILSDIHYVINEIMKQEDENRVELQSLKERMKLNMAKQERGAKAVSQYGQLNQKSHFIDKKT